MCRFSLLVQDTYLIDMEELFACKKAKPEKDSKTKCHAKTISRRRRNGAKTGYQYQQDILTRVAVSECGLIISHPSL